MDFRTLSKMKKKAISTRNTREGNTREQTKKKMCKELKD